MRTEPFCASTEVGWSIEEGVRLVGVPLYAIIAGGDNFFRPGAHESTFNPDTQTAQGTIFNTGGGGPCARRVVGPLTSIILIGNR